MIFVFWGLVTTLTMIFLQFYPFTWKKNVILFNSWVIFYCVNVLLFLSTYLLMDICFQFLAIINREKWTWLSKCLCSRMYLSDICTRNGEITFQFGFSYNLIRHLFISFLRFLSIFMIFIWSPCLMLQLYYIP